jgi:hypothetical protein
VIVSGKSKFETARAQLFVARTTCEASDIPCDCPALPSMKS